MRASRKVLAKTELPRWSAAERLLTVRGRVVKRFRQPAPLQELVLTAFQEQGWPDWIDDPLQHAAGIKPKRRVHDTINNLNRFQEEGRVHFMGDGSGERVGWRPG